MASFKRLKSMCLPICQLLKALHPECRVELGRLGDRFNLKLERSLDYDSNWVFLEFFNIPLWDWD